MHFVLSLTSLDKSFQRLQRHVKPLVDGGIRSTVKVYEYEELQTEFSGRGFTIGA